MNDVEGELLVARSLLKTLKSGIKIVDLTFYNNPDTACFTKEATRAVVDSMLACIAEYEDGFGELGRK